MSRTVYVNGEFVHHHGQRPDRSVYGWKTHTRIEHVLRFGEQNTLAIKVNDWGGGGGNVGLGTLFEMEGEVRVGDHIGVCSEAVRS